MSTSIAASIDDHPCFIVFYFYDPMAHPTGEFVIVV